jgi:putative PIN family toxin of toxin-antitoxin system
MKIVLDTNVFVTIFAPQSDNYAIFQALLQRKITLCVTTDILDEYAEIGNRFLGTTLVNNVLELFDLLPNVAYFVKYYRWQLITADPDDDKFVDCYVASNADYLVTEDKHFKVLKNVPYPPVKVISSKQFLDLLISSS